MQNIRMQLGQRVRQLRKDAGWSQEELGERADLHSTYIGGIEPGERNVTHGPSGPPPRRSIGSEPAPLVVNEVPPRCSAFMCCPTSLYIRIPKTPRTEPGEK
jgi:DNA-binding XRE family transcriptional regulator